jgi:hypothetical protein
VGTNYTVNSTHYTRTMTPEEHVEETLAELAAIEDPVEQFKAAGDAIELARTTYMPGARKIREDAVNKLRQRNMTWGEIGALLGQHRNRVQQIAEGRTGGKPKPKTAKEN